MYQSPSGLLKDISPQEKWLLLSMLDEAIVLSKDYYVDMRPEFQDPIFSAESETRIIGDSIKSVIASTKLPSWFSFSVEREKTNKFGSRVCRLTNDNIVIHFGKVLACGELPAPAKYRLRCAKANTFPDGDRQVEMFFHSSDVLLSDERQYAIVIYGLTKDKSLRFAELIVPNETMAYALDREDLMLYKNKPVYLLHNGAVEAQNKKVVKSKQRRKREGNGDNT